MKKKTVALLLACVLIVGCVIGGSLAWLTDQSAEVKNVFTTSNINIELLEHIYNPDTNTLGEETTTLVDNYKMVPGFTLPKDPWVTVKADSEDCWLFIKVEESDNLRSYIDYAISGDWKELTYVDEEGNVQTVEDVYYISILDDSGRNVKIKILGEGSYPDDDDSGINYGPNQVLVLPTVTKKMMNDLTDTTRPTLTFTAYATQYWKTNNVAFDVYEAWQETAGYQAPAGS